ncbi:MAG: aminotransferase class V-fold PLP-dependent enzyme [Candidatus Ranarchaeia archaeon]
MTGEPLFPSTEFPMLMDPSVIYFDAATMTPCPQSVIEPLGRFYRIVGGIPNRGAHRFSVNATEYQKNAREVVANFFHVSASSLVFTSNNTHAAFIASQLFPLEKGDSVLLSPVLHHGSLVPWIKRTNSEIILRLYFPMPSNGRLTIDDITRNIDPTVKIAVLPYTNIVYGTLTPLAEAIPVLQDHGIRVIIDGTHAAGHVPINLAKLKCDAFYCSGNIGLMGPLGTGILYLNPDMEDLKEPPLVGDGSIESVTYHKYTLLSPPTRYEPGIPDVASQVALATAIQYIEKIGVNKIHEYEKKMVHHLLEQIKQVPHIQLYGDTEHENRIGILGFNIKSLHPHDVAMILDESSNIQVRSGLLCAHPFIQCLSENGVVQLSLHAYNTTEQIDVFIEKLSAIAEDLV